VFSLSLKDNTWLGEQGITIALKGILQCQKVVKPLRRGVGYARDGYKLLETGQGLRAYGNRRACGCDLSRILVRLLYPTEAHPREVHILTSSRASSKVACMDDMSLMAVELGPDEDAIRVVELGYNEHQLVARLYGVR
jgi:hypothetical protein